MSRTTPYAVLTWRMVCCRSMIWMPLRSVKMNVRILGCQRRVRCPKWTPASNRAFIEITDTFPPFPFFLPRCDFGWDPEIRARPAVTQACRIWAHSPKEQYIIAGGQGQITGVI